MCIKSRILVDYALTDKECDVVDAVTGRRVATTARTVLPDTSGALVWRTASGRLFSSSGAGAAGHDLLFDGCTSFSERPFREFGYGVLVVDIGHDQCRLLRFDSEEAVRATPESISKVGSFVVLQSFFGNIECAESKMNNKSAETQM